MPGILSRSKSLRFLKGGQREGIEDLLPPPGTFQTGFDRKRPATPTLTAEGKLESPELAPRPSTAGGPTGRAAMFHMKAPTAGSSVQTQERPPAFPTSSFPLTTKSSTVLYTAEVTEEQGIIGIALGSPTTGKHWNASPNPDSSSLRSDVHETNNQMASNFGDGSRPKISRWKSLFKKTAPPPQQDKQSFYQVTQQAISAPRERADSHHDDEVQEVPSNMKQIGGTLRTISPPTYKADIRASRKFVNEFDAPRSPPEPPMTRGRAVTLGVTAYNPRSTMTFQRASTMPFPMKPIVDESEKVPEVAEDVVASASTTAPIIVAPVAPVAEAVAITEPPTPQPTIPLPTIPLRTSSHPGTTRAPKPAPLELEPARPNFQEMKAVAATPKEAKTPGDMDTTELITRELKAIETRTRETRAKESKPTEPAKESKVRNFLESATGRSEPKLKESKSKSKKKSRKPEQPAPTAAMEIPTISPHLDIDIPAFKMERYSVMFGDLLGPGFSTASMTSSLSKQSSSSLLVRRQGNAEKLKPLKEISVGENEQESPMDYKLQRRATSPRVPTPSSSRLTLFPSTNPVRAPSPLALSAQKAKPLRRSRTAPAKSPLRQTFARGQERMPDSATLRPTASPNQMPALTPTSTASYDESDAESVTIVIAQNAPGHPASYNVRLDEREPEWTICVPKPKPLTILKREPSEPVRQPRVTKMSALSSHPSSAPLDAPSPLSRIQSLATPPLSAGQAVEVQKGSGSKAAGETMEKEVNGPSRAMVGVARSVSVTKAHSPRTLVRRGTDSDVSSSSPNSERLVERTTLTPTMVEVTNRRSHRAQLSEASMI